MPKITPSPLSSAGSPSPAVVSAALAALHAELDDERAARRATEAALCEAEQARGAAEAARQTAEARAARLEAAAIPPRRVVSFRPSHVLKQRIDEGMSNRENGS